MELSIKAIMDILVQLYPNGLIELVLDKDLNVTVLDWALPILEFDSLEKLSLWAVQQSELKL